MQESKGNRRGFNFTLRMSDDERAALERLHTSSEGPRGFGPWLIWAAQRCAGTALPTRADAVPTRVGNTRARAVPNQARIILDLCAGSGAWSQPYLAAGYQVVRVTLPHSDVTTFRSSVPVHGILAAPPCTEFSVAANGRDKPREFLPALEVVLGCLRIIAECQPEWWALENPGRSLIARWLGPVVDSWEPYEFGDPWTKRTALWGCFKTPERGPWCTPRGSAMQRATAAERAMTPPGFARAFFEANP